ncbi:MAG: type VI secretion system baseplate subunit TssG [Acidobacteriia bacterium]|nr:type VI secretion system baseplate subunit TssG [Terriglobia bacterium]
MATENWAQDPHVRLGEVERSLRDHPYSYRFFQAVRVLEMLAPGRSPVGRFSRPETETVRFRAHNALAFPASEIQRMEWKDGEAPLMWVNFMGLTGPTGVLPLCYTELAIERARAKDRTLESFLDLFNHRFISLFYQAWQRYRPQVDPHLNRESSLAPYVRSLIGMGTAGLQDRQEVADESLLFFSGLLALQPRSASALSSILRGYFQVPVDIEQFVGSWCSLPEDNQCCMEDGDTVSEQLGLGAVVGDAVWDRQSRVRIRLGPMPRRKYLDFLPTGSSFQPLRALIHFFSNDTLDFEVQLVLQREQVPLCRLGTEGEEAPRLGWLTWMKSAPGFNRDPEDTILMFQQEVIS